MEMSKIAAFGSSYRYANKSQHWRDSLQELPKAAIFWTLTRITDGAAGVDAAHRQCE
jgi:hypothetical protein